MLDIPVPTWLWIDAFPRQFRVMVFQCFTGTNRNVKVERNGLVDGVQFIDMFKAQPKWGLWRASLLREIVAYSEAFQPGREEWQPMKPQPIGLLASVALLASMSQASAEIVDVTYTGTVTSFYDPNQLIGSNLATGQSFVATYTFDTSLGTLFSAPTQNSLPGGSYFGTTNPLLSASVTIGGSTNSTLPTTNYNQMNGIYRRRKPNLGFAAA